MDCAPNFHFEMTKLFFCQSQEKHGNKSKQTNHRRDDGDADPYFPLLFFPYRWIVRYALRHSCRSQFFYRSVHPVQTRKRVIPRKDACMKLLRFGNIGLGA